MSEKLISPLKDTLRDWVAIKVPEEKYDLHTSKKTEERIGYVRELLEENENLSAMICFNHLASGDPIFAGYVAELINPSRDRKLVAVVSYGHTDLSHPYENAGFLSMYLVMKGCGVESLRVVQKKEDGTYEGGYTEAEAKKSYKDMMVKLKKIMKENKSIILMICPEGHRSDDGQLQKGKNGITHIAKALEPVVIIPEGISYEKYERKSLNFGESVDIGLGEIIVQDQTNRKEVTTDLIMKNIANVLKFKKTDQLTDVPEIRK